MEVNAHTIIGWCWMALGAVWLVSALATKRTARIETSKTGAFHVVLTTVAFLLLFRTFGDLGPLGRRVVPESAAASYAGLVLTVAGILFACWARFFLGRNWSSMVTVKQDHTLIRRGPYRVVRHPIYSGLLLSFLGSAIAFGRLECFVGFLCALVAWRTKSLVEEKFMTQEFGEQYVEYKRHVKALIPTIW